MKEKNEDWTDRAIPHCGEPQEYDRFAVVDAEFVELSDGADFDVKMQYPILGMQYAEERCFVRKEVKERLLEAGRLLPEGITLRVLDAWRPFQLQRELYQKYSAEIVKNFSLENSTEDVRKRVIASFVSKPRKEKIHVPVHTTGGAVDVTLVDVDGNEMDMGTAFDSFSELAHTDYFENGNQETIRKNRRLLYNVMIMAGFTNLPSEWWHYDYGDRFWAYYNQRPILYDGRFTLKEVVRT